MLRGTYTHKSTCECCGEKNVRLYIEVRKPDLPPFENPELENYTYKKPNFTVGIIILITMIVITVYYYIDYFWV